MTMHPTNAGAKSWLNGSRIRHASKITTSIFSIDVQHRAHVGPRTFRIATIRWTEDRREFSCAVHKHLPFKSEFLEDQFRHQPAVWRNRGRQFKGQFRG